MDKSAVKHSSGDVLAGAVLLLISFFFIGFAPAGYLHGVFDSSVSEGNKIPLNFMLTLLVIGLPIAFLGYRLLKKHEYSVAITNVAKETCFISVITVNNVVLPAEIKEYWADTNGIYISGSDTQLIKWSDITSTRWRSIYNYDAYEIVTNLGTYYFSYANPTDAREKTRFYMATYILLGKSAGTGAALGLSLENEKLTMRLRNLHYICIKFIENKATKFENFLNELFVKVIWNTFLVATVTIWFAGAFTANEGYQGLAIFVGVIIGFGYFFYIVNIEQRLSQKLLNTK